MRVDDILPTLLEKCWLMFLILFENTGCDTWRTFWAGPVNKNTLYDKTVSEYPKFQVRRFQILLDIYSPLFGHQGILPQKKDLVQLLPWEACSVVSSYQATIREKPLNIGGRWWWCQMTSDHLQESLGNLVIWLGSLIIVLPEPALLTLNRLFVTFSEHLRHLNSSSGAFR